MLRNNVVWAPDGDGTEAPAGGAENAAAGQNQVQKPDGSVESTGEDFILDATTQMESFLDEVDLPPAGEGGVQGVGSVGERPRDPREVVEVTPPLRPQVQQPTVRAPVAQPGQTPQAAVGTGQQPQGGVPDGQAPVDGQIPQGTPQVQQAYREPQVDPFALAREHLVGAREQFVDALGERVYPISDQEAQSLLEEGGGAKVSKLLARVQVNTVESVMSVVSQNLPVYINALLKVRQQYSEVENAFWDANPHLNKEQHRQYVGPIANTYKASAPQADQAQINRMVGLLVAAAAGVPIPGQGQAPVPNGNGQAKRGSAMPPVRTPGRVVRSAPQTQYAPSGVQGAGSAPGQAQPQRQFWDLMTEAFQREEAGDFDNTR